MEDQVAGQTRRTNDRCPRVNTERLAQVKGAGTERQRAVGGGVQFELQIVARVGCNVGGMRGSGHAQSAYEIERQNLHSHTICP